MSSMRVQLIVGRLERVAGDVERHCGTCGVLVFHQRNAPEAPLALCPACARDRLRTLAAPPVLVITPQQIAAVLEQLVFEHTPCGTTVH